MATAEGGDVNFREPSNSEVDFNVHIVQQSRDYFEHFQMYAFYYVMRIEFSRDADSSIFISDLLNVHSDALERVFSAVLRTMVESVQLQHFNRNDINASDYLQFTLEHVDFVNYVYSSRSVAYENFRFQRIVGGIMNWLSNLAQSNRQIDICRYWVICLKISRMEEVPRGMGKRESYLKMKFNFPLMLMYK